MGILARVEERPAIETLTAEEQRLLSKHFDANAYELNIDGKRVDWKAIDEVEVAQAARESGPSGWFVKKFVFGGERYHVGVYFDEQEAVLINLTLPAASFVVQTIAYYANKPIQYKGIEGVAPVTEG